METLKCKKPIWLGAFTCGGKAGFNPENANPNRLDVRQRLHIDKPNSTHFLDYDQAISCTISNLAQIPTFRGKCARRLDYISEACSCAGTVGANIWPCAAASSIRWQAISKNRSSIS